jgi:hypothetical protein
LIFPRGFPRRRAIHGDIPGEYGENTGMCREIPGDSGRGAKPLQIYVHINALWSSHLICPRYPERHPRLPPCRSRGSPSVPPCTRRGVPGLPEGAGRGGEPYTETKYPYCNRPKVTPGELVETPRQPDSVEMVPGGPRVNRSVPPWVGREVRRPRTAMTEGYC